MYFYCYLDIYACMRVDAPACVQARRGGKQRQCESVARARGRAIGIRGRGHVVPIRLRAVAESSS